MKHPLVGTLVTGRFLDAHRVGLVVNVRFPRKGSGAPHVHVRLHGGQETLVEGSDWDAVLRRYRGQRCDVPVTHLKQVLPGEGEGWVDASEYLEWSEA